MPWFIMLLMIDESRFNTPVWGSNCWKFVNEIGELWPSLALLQFPIVMAGVFPLIKAAKSWLVFKPMEQLKGFLVAMQWLVLFGIGPGTSHGIGPGR